VDECNFVSPCPWATPASIPLLIPLATHMPSSMACAASDSCVGLDNALHQGLTLVHYSAQPEMFMTQNTP
jgi:hypothetical protein